MKERKRVVIIDHSTGNIHGTIGHIRRVTTCGEDTQPCLSLSTYFECAFCQQVTYLLIEIRDDRGFHVSASPSTFHQQHFVPLKSDDFRDRIRNLGILHEWCFIAPCASGCDRSTTITLLPQTLTSMVQTSTPSTWKWPVNLTQEWVIPMEIRWVLSKWRGEKDFTSMLKEGEQIALSLRSVETQGEACPWQLRAFEWAQSRFVDDCSLKVFDLTQMIAWLGWVTQHLYGLVVPEQKNKDEIVHSGNIGLGIVLESSSFVRIAPKRVEIAS